MAVSNGVQVQSSTPRRGPRPVGLGLRALAFFLCLVVPRGGEAEPLRRPLYPQDRQLLDLIVRTTDDPDLLTSRQAVLRDQWKRLGVAPGGRTPSLATVWEARAAEKAEFDLFGPPRVRTEWIFDLENDVIARITIPEAALFTALSDTNAVGIAFRLPRDWSRADIGVDISSARAHLRTHASIALRNQWDQQVRNRAASGDAAGDLLNFTIPIKIPRTLERIIGRGEATNIRISGTEEIRIGGQSTRRSDFVASEIQQNQSLFPQLELEQRLRVDLVGQVGEKIKVRVSHNSQAVGTESTEIKLSFEGDEDDIVQTIRAGDIDVTLPGSSLLGVGASRGGLFGLKVEGAVGPIQYTLLTSKEEATQENKTFSQAGGSATEETVVIRDIDYARGRFFRLTAPVPLFFPQEGLRADLQDGSLGLVEGVPAVQGTNPPWRIDPESVQVYTLAGAGSSDEYTVDHGIAVLDDRGIGWEGIGDGAGFYGVDSDANGGGEATAALLAQFVYDNYVLTGRAQTGTRWRRLQRGDVGQTGDWYPLGDFSSGEIIGIEMARSYTDREMLAVTYDIVDDEGNLVRRVGRSTTRENSTLPNLNVDDDANDIGDIVSESQTLAPRVQIFKLLKPRNPTNPVGENGDYVALALTWEYEFRNFYDLRGRNIDETSFRMQIERNNTSIEFPEREQSTSIPWIQIFGLDQENTSDQPIPDSQVDLDDTSLFNLERGVLQFPLAQPFNMGPAAVQEFSDGALDSLDSTLRAPKLYRSLVNTRQEQIELNRFNMVVQQSGVSSNLRLNTFNIREGSEEVVLNGRTLTRGTDYDIDYFTGEINLKGDALAELNAQSNIQVRYEQNPLFGGGRTSLSGVNLSGRFFESTQLSTTWLYQTRPNAQTKVRLGEEPKRNLVGNFSVRSRIEPEWTRGIADALSRLNVDRTPSFDLTAEVAVSVPNPNTKDTAYLEDFENVDQTVQISLGRDGWWWASLPVRGPDLRALAGSDSLRSRKAFEPQDRAYVGWHRPASGGSLLQGQVNPALTELEQNDLIPTLEIVVRADASPQSDYSARGGWAEDEYAGIMRSLGEVDLTQAQFLEFWVDAGDDPLIEGRTDNPSAFSSAQDAFAAPRSGTLHFDFGDINEDFFWPAVDDSTYLLGIENREDQDNDGILGINQEDGQSEDRGLDGLLDREESLDNPPIAGRPGRGTADPAGDDYDAVSGTLGEFTYINGTEGNERLDAEDINRDGTFDLEDGFFRVSVDLDDQNALVDIYRDFTDDDFQPLPGYEGFINEALNERRTWRRFRLDLREAIKLIRGEGVYPDELAPGAADPYFGREPDLSRIRTLRVWYEPDGNVNNPNEPNVRRIRLADMRFLGNRWIADQVRDEYDRIVEDDPDTPGIDERNGQDFRLGVLNNKDNAGTYEPPIDVVRRNNQDELEQSLQILYQLDRGNGMRAYKDLPGRTGESYLNYDELNFFWRFPYSIVDGGTEGVGIDEDQGDLEGFYWVGSDSLNYYEITMPFGDVRAATPIDDRIIGDWFEISVQLSDLSNVREDGEEGFLYPDAPADVVNNPDNVRRGTVIDTRTGVEYPVKVVGRPDLERVTRYYVGLRAPQSAALPTYRGEILFNELRLRGVNRRVGFAQRYALNAQIPGVADLQLDLKLQDAEFRGLNSDLGTGINSTQWNARVSTKVQNWLPTGGIDLPITLQRSSDLDLPKYEPNSDRELLDEADQQEFRTESTTERFSLQFRKPKPSENVLLRYTVDRFNYSINGTRSERFSPTSESKGKSADQRYSYDLQLRKAPTIPIPFTGIEIGVIPRQVQVTSSWRFSESESFQKSLETGEPLPVNRQVTKGNTNQMQLTLAPLNDLSTSMNFNSGRNQLLDGGLEIFGIDFGVEETFSQTLGMQYKPDYPWIRWARPTVNYTGAYNENRRSSIRVQANSAQEDDADLVVIDGRLGVPGEVRNVSNRADWNLRSELDVKGFLGFAKDTASGVFGIFGGLIPDGGDSPADPGTSPPVTPQPGTSASFRGPSAGPRFALAQTRDESPPPPPPGTPPPGDRPPPPEKEAAPPGDETAADAPSDSTAEDQGPLLLRLDYGELAKKAGTPVVSFWKNLRPLSVTWQQQRNTSFNQINGRADVLYRFGFSNEPDFDSIQGIATGTDETTGELVREDYFGNSETRNRTFAVNTQSKLSSKISVDASYRKTSSERDGNAGATGSSTTEWPSFNVRVQGVGEWGIWKSIGDPFQSSNLDFSYKRNEQTPNAPLATPLPPRIDTTIQPRWNVRLRSGLDANLAVTIGSKESTSLQSRQFSDDLRVNLTVRQSFDAEGRLKFLRFGRKGTGSNIDMTITASFTKNDSYRETDTVDAEGVKSTKKDQVQGRRNLTIGPQFSYQFSRNLRASLQLNFGRREVTNTGAVDLSLGIFFEATLNF